MRPLVFAVLSLVLAGCASAKRPEFRGATPEEQAKVDAALTPLIQASGLCRPKEPCAVGLAIEVRQRIYVAAGPASQKKFVLRITTGALRSLQPSELQSALAHELGHVQLSHFESREVRRHQVAGATQPAVNGASDGVVRASRASDREEEFAADRYAVELLDRLPGDPARGCTDMLLLLERLDLEQLTPGWANWLSTHPTAAARLQALQVNCDKKP
jgi:Zn-dependent protease with chaperone function